METELRAQRAPVDLRAPTGRAQCAWMHRRRTPARRRASRARRPMLAREVFATCVLRGASRQRTRLDVMRAVEGLRARAASVSSARQARSPLAIKRRASCVRRRLRGRLGRAQYAETARSRMPSTLAALSAALGLLVCMVHATVARAVLRRHRAGRSAWRATIRTSSIRPITVGRVLRALAVWRARRDAQQTHTTASATSVLPVGTALMV